MHLFFVLSWVFMATCISRSVAMLLGCIEREFLSGCVKAKKCPAIRGWASDVGTILTADF